MGSEGQTSIHLPIKDGKIWIEADETDQGFANVLLSAGVPRQDIVLAFHPPELRRLSEFSAA